MDFSLSNSLSKNSIFELDEPVAAGDAISTEEIYLGDTLLDTYEVQSDAIKGGMGSVWKVYHKRWDTLLAMKRPQPKFFAEGSEERKQNFIHECEAWIDLELHPNIVSCYYVREIGGVPTIFSEWLDNGSLKNRIEDGTLYETEGQEDLAPEEKERMILARILDLAIQFARGLDYAHESAGHLIHQDVKPDNLLLTHNWEAKVADFGLARARAHLKEGAESFGGDETESADYSFSEKTHMSPTGGYTPAYCSPEQLRGGKLSRRTDIYSWAASVLEMFCGSRPWKSGVEAGENCETYFSGAVVEIPESLKTLLKQCFDSDPNKRPHDFSAVERVLTDIFYETIGQPYERPSAKAARDTADSLNNRALSYLDLEMDEKAESCFDEALEKMPDHAGTLFNRSLYLWRDGRMAYDEMIRHCSAISADEEGGEEKLELLAKEKNDTEPLRLKAEDSERDRKTGVQHTEVCVSRDGKRLYTGFDQPVCYDLDRGRIDYAFLAAKGKAAIKKMMLSDDGRKLFLYSDRLHILDAAGGEEIAALPFDKANSEADVSFCITPDGNTCFASDGECAVKKYDLQTGDVLVEYTLDAPNGAETDNPENTIKEVGLCDAGQSLYAVQNDTVIFWDEATGARRSEKSFGKTVNSVCFSGDGSRMYAATADGFLVWDRETGQVSAKETSAPLKQVKTASGDRFLLTYDALCNVRIWDTRKLLCLRALHGTDRRLTSLAFSDDITRIAAADDKGNVMVWDLSKEVRYTPWQLSRIKEYRVVIEREEKTNQLYIDIQNAIDQKDINKALALLKQGETQYDTYEFFSLRRQIMQYCRRKQVEREYEILSYDLKERFFRYEDKVSVPYGAFVVDQQSGNTAIRNSDDPVIRIRDEKGNEISSLEMSTDYASSDYMDESITFSRSGKLLAAGGTGCVTILDVQSRTEIKNLDGEYTIFHLAFSPDDKLLAALGEGLLGRWWMGIWHVDSGRRITSINKVPPKASGFLDMFSREVPIGIEFLPDGKQIIVVLSRSVKIYDIASGRFVNEFNLKSECICIKFAARREVLYLFTEDGVMQINTRNWHYSSNKKLYLGNIDISGMGRFAKSPDDTMLAGRSNNTFGLWSLPDFKLIKEFTGFESVWQLTFSNDSCVLHVITANTVHSIAIQKELEFPGFKDWDKEAAPYLKRFLAVYPEPNEEEIQMFFKELRNSGLGYISEKEIRERIRTGNAGSGGFFARLFGR